jgi:hypothetical protein
MLYQRVVYRALCPVNNFGCYCVCCATQIAARLVLGNFVVRQVRPCCKIQAGFLDRGPVFAASVLTSLIWDPRKLLEGLILCNFVVRQVRPMKVSVL